MKTPATDYFKYASAAKDIGLGLIPVTTGIFGFRGGERIAQGLAKTLPGRAKMIAPLAGALGAAAGAYVGSEGGNIVAEKLKGEHETEEQMRDRILRELAAKGIQTSPDPLAQTRDNVFLATRGHMASA